MVSNVVYPMTSLYIGNVMILLSKRDKAIFMVMLASSFWVKILGQLYVVEIIFLIIVMHYLLFYDSSKELFHPRLMKYFNYLLLALMGQLITDLIRGTDKVSFLKGFSLIIFTMINLLGLVILTRNSHKSILTAIVGWSFGLILGVLLQPSAYAQEYPWKMGFAYPVTIIYLFLISRKSMSKGVIIPLTLVIVGADLFYGARSLAAITFLAVAMSIPSLNHSKKTPKLKINRISNLALLLIWTSIFFAAYSTLASQGVLGENSREKYSQQSSSSLGLLIAGRTEVVSQYYAIKKSPLLGYGSYAPLTAEIREKVVNSLVQNGLNPSLKELKYGTDYMIPVHSGIFEFWLWFGILGVPFFVRIIRDSLRVLFNHALNPVIVFFSLQAIWDSLFSPYMADRRIQFPLIILLLISTLNSKFKKFDGSKF